MELRLDERLDVSVQHRVDVSHLEASAVVLDQPIRLQDVGADLRAELDVLAFAPQVFQPLLALPAHPLGQPGLQDAHSHSPVLNLGPLVLARRRDAGGEMRDAHGRVGDVHVLATRARR